jgi:hypothetical protein
MMLVIIEANIKLIKDKLRIEFKLREINIAENKKAAEPSRVL